jgi:hypothetical protein
LDHGGNVQVGGGHFFNQYFEFDRLNWPTLIV